MAIKGERMVPPRIAPMLMTCQNPSPRSGNQPASMPPSAAPMMSSGASTPPEVPEPSDTDQMVHLTSMSKTTAEPTSLPWSSCSIVS
jgi:hypothetical protein